MVTPWISAAQTAFPESPYAQTAVEYATYVLYRLTAEKYPGVTRTFETYVAETLPQVPSQLSSPVSRDIIQRIGVPASIQYPQRLYLRGAPAHAVFSVQYGNTTLDPTEYTLFNKRFLRLNNGAIWNYACDQKGITVDYSYGMLPPQAGILAATTLANELLILLGEGTSEAQCRIP